MKINFRNILAITVALYLIYTGKLRRYKIKVRNKKYITSVYFHNPSKQLFDKCVKWFINNGFKFLSADELYDIIVSKKTLNSPTVIFTIDDGWRENKENVVSVVNKYKIPVSIFVVSDMIQNKKRFWWSYIEEANMNLKTNISIKALKSITNESRIEVVEKSKLYATHCRESLTEIELKEINKNEMISIGSHTVTHPILTKCDNLTSRNEITISKISLEKILNTPIMHFAYPNGSYSEREVNYLKECGYKMAFTTKPEYIKIDSMPDLFEIPRFDVLENVSFLENICRMTGIWFEKYKV